MFVLFPEANIFWTLKTFCVLCIQMSRESMKTKLKQMKTKKILESQLMTKIINTVTLSSYFSNIFNALQFMLVFDPFVWNVRDFSSMLSNFYLVHMFSMQAMWSIVRPLVENERFPSGSLRMSTKASQTICYSSKQSDQKYQPKAIWKLQIRPTNCRLAQYIIFFVNYCQFQLLVLIFKIFEYIIGAYRHKQKAQVFLLISFLKTVSFPLLDEIFF